MTDEDISLSGSMGSHSRSEPKKLSPVPALKGHEAMPSGWFIRNVSTDRRSGQAPFKKPITARRSRSRKHRSRFSEIRT